MAAATRALRRRHACSHRCPRHRRRDHGYEPHASPACTRNAVSTRRARAHRGRRERPQCGFPPCRRRRQLCRRRAHLWPLPSTRDLADDAGKPRPDDRSHRAPDAARLSDLPTYSHFGYRYWRQLTTGQVLVGGWRDTAYEVEVGYDERPTAGIQSHLDAQLKSMGAEAPVTHRWAGTMGFTESGLPLVGPVEGMKNAYICAGFNGHGMGFAFISAKQLVDSI